MITSAPLGERSRLSSRLDERLQHGFQRDSSLSRARLSALELDPAFVEAIKHLDAGCGVLHSLRFEYRLPSLSCYWFHSHSTAKQFSSRGCQLVLFHTVLPLQFYD